MYKKYKLINLKLPRFKLLTLGMLSFGNVWIDLFPFLRARSLQARAYLCTVFPTCVIYILLEGNDVIGRGRHGVIILNGWLDWSVIRLAGPLCPVTACITYKVTPSWVQSEVHFFPFSCCATKTGILLKRILCIFFHPRREGWDRAFCSGQKAEENHREL